MVPAELAIAFLALVGLGDLLWMMMTGDLTNGVVVFPMMGLPLGDTLALKGLDLPELAMVDLRGLFRGKMGLDLGELELLLVLVLVALFLGEMGRLLLGELLFTVTDVQNEPGLGERTVAVLWAETGLDLGELLLTPLVLRGVDLGVPALRPPEREETGLDLSAPFDLIPPPFVGVLSPLDIFFPLFLVGVRLDDLLTPTGDTTGLTECEVLKSLSPPSLVLMLGRRGDEWLVR